MNGRFARALRVELRKAFVNPWFIACLLIGIGFAVAESFQVIPMRLNQEISNKLYFESVYGGSSPNSSYVNNLLVDPICSAARIFYVVVPLLIALANSWSLSTELKGGYANLVLMRESKGTYFASKWLATFIVGGIACVVPLVVSVVISCCFLPAYPIDVYDFTYVPMDYSRFLGSLFYENPLLFTAVRIGLDFIMAGIWAAFVQSISLLIENRVTLLVGSFVAMLALNSGSQMLYSLLEVQGPALTLMTYLQGCAYALNVWPSVMAIEIILLAAVSIALPWAMRKRDVL